MTKITTAFESLSEPDDFVPLRDETSIIGYQHTRYYQIAACDSDGWVGVSTCAYDWARVVEDTRRYLSQGSHHVRISAIESRGNGYFQPETTSRVIADVVR